MTAVPYRLDILSPATDLGIATRLLAIQRAAYLVEAGLIGDDRIPALHEAVGDVQMLPVSWLGAYLDRERGGAESTGAGSGGAESGGAELSGPVLVGAIAWTASAHDAAPSGVDIDRLVVDPAVFRQGVGRALVLGVLERAGDREVTVSTGRGNAPAANLYRALGFVPVGDIEVIPRLWVSQFVRPAP